MTGRERHHINSRRKYKDPKTGKVKRRKTATMQERVKSTGTGRSVDQLRAEKKQKAEKKKAKAAPKPAPKKPTSTRSAGPLRANSSRSSSRSYSRWTRRYKKKK